MPVIQRNTFFFLSFSANNLNVTHEFYTHPKILIAALNGPAIGLSAALALSDFIYCVPHTFILKFFSSIGIVSDGVASRAFVQRFPRPMRLLS